MFCSVFGTKKLSGGAALHDIRHAEKLLSEGILRVVCLADITAGLEGIKIAKNAGLVHLELCADFGYSDQFLLTQKIKDPDGIRYRTEEIFVMIHGSHSIIIRLAVKLAFSVNKIISLVFLGNKPVKC